jgi:hypothetical protein
MKITKSHVRPKVVITKIKIIINQSLDDKKILRHQKICDIVCVCVCLE